MSNTQKALVKLLEAAGGVPLNLRHFATGATIKSLMRQGIITETFSNDNLGRREHRLAEKATHA